MHVGSEDPTDEDMTKIRSMSVYSPGLTWKKAHFAGIGSAVTSALFYQPPEKLFEVRIKFRFPLAELVYTDSTDSQVAWVSFFHMEEHWASELQTFRS